MATRNISPTAWNSPGIEQVGFNVILSNLSENPIDLDSWINQYSPVLAETVNWTSSGNPNSISIPAGANTRFMLIILPRNNTATCIIKGATSGDAGFYINPNGFVFLSFDGNHVPANMNAVISADITGVQIYVG